MAETSKASASSTGEGNAVRKTANKWKQDVEGIKNMVQGGGHIHLITGNHDAVWPGHRQAHQHQRRWLMMFESVQQYARRRIGRGRTYMLSHFPYMGDHTTDERYTEFRLRDGGNWLLHGHVHDQWKVNDRQINVGVDMWDWTPVHLDQLVELMTG